ncbi:hypothetical protein ElyMa_005735400 [Elysia marginata]|uniref:Uncharacterized protein n=1 Tax=Elysia marginata TaxID=1093978 RepID=A0AAV4FK01_9GAST|nr:hypothetical protein ElyMa_005735400 [Elysia marginata]
MSGAEPGPCQGRSLGHVRGGAWPMSGAEPGLCQRRSLVHVRGGAWPMSGAEPGPRKVYSRWDAVVACSLSWSIREDNDKQQRNGILLLNGNIFYTP